MLFLSRQAADGLLSAKRKPGFAARVVDVVYKFVRRVLSLAAAMGTYDDTFIRPTSCKGPDSEQSGR